jgi:hypothetical protein
MHPYLLETIATARQSELIEEAARRGLAKAARRPAPGPEVTVRFARDTDAIALDRLAQLSERQIPNGTLLVGSVRGEITAAVAIEGGSAIADPFRPTAAVVAELRGHARRLRAPLPWLRIPHRRSVRPAV